MADPRYSDRWTELYTVSASPGGQLILDGNIIDRTTGPSTKAKDLSGFIVDAAGTVTLLPLESNVAQTLTVLAGVKYDIAFRALLAIGGSVTTVIGGR